MWYGMPRGSENGHMNDVYLMVYSAVIVVMMKIAHKD